MLAVPRPGFQPLCFVTYQPIVLGTLLHLSEAAVSSSVKKQINQRTYMHIRLAHGHGQ